MAEKKSSPELRFPEFEGEWEERKLGEFFSSRREKGNSSLPIYSVSQSKGLVPRESLNRNIQNDANPKDNLVVQPTDLAYNMMRMWQGAVGTATEPCMVSPAYVVLKAKIGNNSLFFLYLFEKRRSKYLFTAYSYGLTLDRLRLYYKDFANIRLSAPKGEEQQKIASFLTAVDQRIELLQKKKAKLEEYKKGVMQKLFSREIRFRDENGNEFSDWEEKRLGEILIIGSGKDYKHLKEGDIPVYGTGGYMLSVSDYLYDGESVGIGRKGTIDKPIYLTGKFWTVDTLFYTHSFKKVLPFFVFIVFQQMDWKKYNEASGVPSLSKSTLEKIKIYLPSLPEQQKIADFLSILDRNTKQVGIQIEKTQGWKKGLLQKMFW